MRPAQDPAGRTAPPSDRWLRSRHCPVLRVQGLAQSHRIRPLLRVLRVRAGYRDRAIASELARFRSSQYRLQGQTLRVASSSFQHGMAQRLAERLEAMHRERDVSVAAQRAEGTALMLVKHRVVDDAFRETDIRLRAATSRTTIHLNGAFRHGRQAGDRVNLDRPIGGQALTRLGG